MNFNSFTHKARAFTAATVLLSISPAVFAHSGHSHAQFDGLTGILHALTTQPLLFGVIGLVILSAIFNMRH